MRSSPNCSRRTPQLLEQNAEDLLKRLRTHQPGAELVIDIIGVGPVRALVRWSQSGKFGVRFTSGFDLSRLAGKRENQNPVTMLKPWYVADRQAG